MSDRSEDVSWDDGDTFARLINSARDGSPDALGTLLENCRPYLLFIATQELDSGIVAKVGASDVVQNTVISAQRCLDQFNGSTEQELLAWLRDILMKDLMQARRHYQTQKRQVALEVRLSESFEHADQAGIHQHSRKSPAQETETRERHELLGHAMDQLSSEDQQVIRLRHWDRMTFVQIGEQTNRSEDAARKHWSRAVVKLQKILDPEE